QVGDVWLDAGIVPFSTLKYFTDRDYWKEYFPAEYVVEMKEQIRLWFYSMLFMSTVLIDEPPYEQVGTYGTVFAEDGSKFSKTGFMIRFDEAADKVGADPSRYIYAAAPITNDVRYGFNLGAEAKRKLLAYWNLSTFFATYAEIDHPRVDVSKIDIEKLSLTDRWLLALVGDFVRCATEAYENYSTKDVVAYFEKAVDDISNFYVRVNRRRFWKVEDSGDKMTAYTVMMYAIKTITQIMAPIIPFMTEHVWREVVLRYSTESAESVHLTDWPEPIPGIEKYNEVIGEVDEVRNIISLVLKLRNEKQIRIRQPLKTLYLCLDEGTVEIDDALIPIMLGEVNIKELVKLDSPDALEVKTASLDFRKAGAHLKGDVNVVKGLLATLSDDEMEKTVSEIEAGGEVHVAGYGSAMPAELFALTSHPRDNVSIVKDAQLTVSVDTTLTQELIDEGYLRDILRQCQVFRKEADFNVSDRIEISFEGPAELVGVIDAKRDFVSSELLATIRERVDSPEYTGDIELDAGTVKVAMSRLSK
ncbi:MAG: class I tRNA ligase family protein, partial [Clostridia bacterium]|nr:class I tRNA ligase family protein [Clostridia bacterium]